MELLTATSDGGVKGIAPPPGKGSFSSFLAQTLEAVTEDEKRKDGVTACSLLRDAYTAMYEYSLAPRYCAHLFASKMDQPSIPLRRIQGALED